MLRLPSLHFLGRNVDEAALKYRCGRNVNEAALKYQCCLFQVFIFWGEINRGRNVDQAAFIDIRHLKKPSVTNWFLNNIKDVNYELENTFGKRNTKSKCLIGI